MNRRLMMAQQNKGFELVYDAASGELPSNTGQWTQTGSFKIENGLLYTKNEGLYSSSRIRPIGHLQADRSEIIVEIESWEKYNHNGSSLYQGVILALGLSDGTYYATCSLTEKQLCIGKVANRGTISSAGIWANLKNIDYKAPQKFTFRMVFDSGLAYYYINDELLYTQTTLLDVSTIQGDTTLTAAEMYNTVRFGQCSYVYVSKITYKEW